MGFLRRVLGVVLAVALFGGGLDASAQQKDPKASPADLGFPEEGFALDPEVLNRPDRSDKPPTGLERGEPRAPQIADLNDDTTADQKLMVYEDPRLGPFSPYRIDNRIIESRSEKGVLENASNSFLVQFREISKGGVTVTSMTGEVFRFEAIDSNVSNPVVDESGTSVTYPDVWDGVDVQYVVEDDHVEEFIVAKRNPGRSSFGFRTFGGELRATDSGGFSIVSPAKSPDGSEILLPMSIGQLTAIGKDGLEIPAERIGLKARVGELRRSPAFVDEPDVSSLGRGEPTPSLEQDLFVETSDDFFDSLEQSEFPVRIDPTVTVVDLFNQRRGMDEPYTGTVAGVNLATGLYNAKATDLAVPSISDIPFGIERLYSSGALESEWTNPYGLGNPFLEGGFGVGWNSYVAGPLAGVSPGIGDDLVITRADGSREYYVSAQPWDGSYESPPGVSASLTRTPAGAVTRTELDGSGKLYGTDGQILWDFDSSGRLVTYQHQTYNPSNPGRHYVEKVTDWTSGREILLTWGVPAGTSKQVVTSVKVEESSGVWQTWTYRYAPASQSGYSAFPVLKEVYNPENPWPGTGQPLPPHTSYTYDGLDLEDWIDPEGNYEVRLEYSNTTGFPDADPIIAGHQCLGCRRTSNVTDGESNSTSITYVPNPTSVEDVEATVIDPRSNTTVWGFDDSLRLVRRVNESLKTRTWTYGVNTGFLAEMTLEDDLPNARSRETYFHDGDGRLTATTDRYDATTYFGYDADGRLVSEKGQRSAQTPNSDPPTSTDTTYETVTEYYGATRRVKKITPPAPLGSTSYTYTPEGTGLPAVGSTGAMPANLLRQVTNPLGGSTVYSYNSSGDATRVDDPNGLRTEFTTDGLGRQLTRVESGSGINNGSNTGLYSGAQTWTTTYDKLNRPTSVTHPLVPAANGEVAHRLKETTTYTDNGLVDTVTSEDIAATAPDRVTDNDYDDADRLVTEKSTLNGTLSVETSTEYDGNGNVKAIVDQENRRYEATYDIRDNLKTVTLKNYQDNPAGSSTPFDLQVAAYDYDDTDRRSAETDAEGRRIEFTNYLAGDTPGLVTLKDFAPLPAAQGGPGGPDVDVLLESNFVDKAGNVQLHTEGDELRGTFSEFWPSNDLKRQYVTNSTASAMYRDTSWTYNGNGDVLKETQSAISTPGVSDRETRYQYTTGGLNSHVTIENGSTDLVTFSTFDARGNPLTVQDPDQKVTELRYNPIGALWFKRSPSITTENAGGSPTTGRVTTGIGYNAFGETTRTVDGNGNITKTDYDELGRSTKITHPTYTAPSGGGAIEPTEDFEYDKVGNLIESKDRRDRVSTYEFDKLNRPYKATTPGTVSGTPAIDITTYDRVGNISGTIDANGAMVTATYDDLNRQRSSTEIIRAVAGQSAESNVTWFNYDFLGNQIYLLKPNGDYETSTYNPANDQTSVTSAWGQTTVMVPSPFGEISQTISPQGTCQEAQYDQAGRITASRQRGNLCALTATSNPSWLETAFAYDKRGNETTMTTPEGRVTKKSYDNAARLIDLTVGYGTSDAAVTKYFYDKNGNNTRIRNGRGNQAGSASFDVTTSYQSWNLPETRTEPPATTGQPAADRQWTTSYDAAGLPTRETQPGNVRIDKTYDYAGRIATEIGTGASLNRTTTYDVSGRITSIDTASTSAINLPTYNDRNQPLSITGGNSNTSYTYDQLGRVSQRDDTNGTSEFSYNPSGTVATQSDPLTGGTTAFYYNADDQEQYKIRYAPGMTVGDPFTENPPWEYNTYDEFGRQSFSTAFDEVQSGTMQYGKQYFYDKDSNLSQILLANSNSPHGAGFHQYSYDNRNQLKSWTDHNSAVTNYGYDKNGNRTSAGASTFTYDNQDRITTGGGESFTWSDRGTLTSITSGGTTRSTTFDAEGKELASTLSGTTTTLVYDGLGRIDARNTTAFKYSGLDLDPADDGTWKTNHSLDGKAQSLKQGSIAHWAHTDTHNDLVALHKTDGTIADTTTYDTWGTVTGTTGSLASTLTVGFQSDYTDPDTGQVWMGARHYRPESASFTSRDTYAGQLQSPISLNRYTYAHNNPLNMLDPDGHAPLEKDYNTFALFYKKHVGNAANHTSGSLMLAFRDAANAYEFHQYVKMQDAFGEGVAKAQFPNFKKSVIDPVVAYGMALATAEFKRAHPTTVNREDLVRVPDRCERNIRALVRACAEADGWAMFQWAMFDLSAAKFKTKWIEQHALARGVSERTVHDDWDAGSKKTTLDSNAAKRNGWWDLSADFCSNGPDTSLSYDFKLACMRHDFGWRNLKRLDEQWNCEAASKSGPCGENGLQAGAAGKYDTKKNRLAVNDRFYSDMKGHCATRSLFLKITCYEAALEYKWLVDRFS